MTFDEVAAKHSKRLFNMILRLTQDYDDALDLTQDVLLQAYKAFPRFRGESEVFTWLYRIGINRCRRAYRRKRLLGVFSPRHRISLEDADTRGELRHDEEGDLEAADRHRLVRRKVDTLPPKYREAVVLRYFQELSYEEMAQILQTSVGTVKSRLARARGLLERKLKPILESEQSN